MTRTYTYVVRFMDPAEAGDARKERSRFFAAHGDAYAFAKRTRGILETIIRDSFDDAWSAFDECERIRTQKPE